MLITGLTKTHKLALLPTPWTLATAMSAIALRSSGEQLWKMARSLIRGQTMRRTSTPRRPGVRRRRRPPRSVGGKCALARSRHRWSASYRTTRRSGTDPDPLALVRHAVHNQWRQPESTVVPSRLASRTTRRRTLTLAVTTESTTQPDHRHIRSGSPGTRRPDKVAADGFESGEGSGVWGVDHVGA